MNFIPYSLQKNTKRWFGFVVLLPVLVFLGLMTLDVLADTQAPTSPGSLKGVRYSSTAGEILWTPSTDNDFIIGYRVTRDGQDLGLKDARSVFVSTLVPERVYTYEVSAVDRSGNEGPAMVVSIPGNIGGVEQGVLLDSDNPDPDDPEDPVHEPDLGQSVVLSSDRARISLREGDQNGQSMALSVDRRGVQTGHIAFTVSADNPKDLTDIEYHFSSASLAPDHSGSVLTIKLAVGVAPLRPHTRKLRITASSEKSTSHTEIQIDVQPVQAPDVYLLIGQSNMEGYSEVGSRERYPGGQDARHERIKQLNVQPNSRTIFVRDNDFASEAVNVFSPLFVPAEDPLHEPRYIGVEGKGATFVGLGLTFAKHALADTTNDVYLVPAAWGASGFCRNANGNLAWNASVGNENFLGGSLLLERALTRLNLTLRETGGVLRGILWHQGGADSNHPDCARTYARNLNQMVKRLRREARVDARGTGSRGDEAAIPFIVATQSKGDDGRGRFSIFNPYKEEVDQAHRDVRNMIVYSDYVNNDDLVPPSYPCGQVSCVHFGAAALREQGRRFYAATKRVWADMKAYHF